MIHCPLCDKRLKGKWIKRTYKSKEDEYDHFYQCQDAYQSSNPGCVVCNGQNYRADLMELLTGKAVATIAKNPELVEKALLAYSQRTNVDQIVSERKALQKSLNELKAREAATIEAQISGIAAGASASAYAKIFKQIAKEREQIEARIALMTQQEKQRVEPRKTAKLLAQIYSDVEEALAAAEVLPSERRQLLGRVVSRIIRKKDEEGEWSVLVELHSPYFRSRQKWT